MGKKILHFLDNVESYVCQVLLAFFITMIFIQIISRELGFSLSWSEEISRFSFVWFVFFGASYAARIGAHNRITLQFKLLPKFVETICLLLADIIWVAFNCLFIYKSIDVIGQLQARPYSTPGLNWQLWAIYLIFPISFILMTIRIIQVNILKFVFHQELEDPDKVEVEAVAHPELDPLMIKKGAK